MSNIENKYKRNNEILEARILTRNNRLQTKRVKDLQEIVYKYEINVNKTEESLSLERNETINLYKIDLKSQTTMKEEQDIINIRNFIYNPETKVKKKVRFSEPELANVIIIESYKQYNKENTCKDPYDFNYYKDRAKEDKERVMCSCLVV